MKLILSLFTITTSVFSQETSIVVNKNTKEPLPYTAIKTRSGGFYTDVNGVFILPENSDSLYISHLGYKNLKIISTAIKDTVFLAPKPLNLEEVILTKKKTSLIKIEPLKSDKLFASLPLKPKQEIIINLKPNDKNEGLYIRKIVFPLGKIKYFNKTDTLYKNAVGVFRLNIYTNNQDSLPKQVVFTSKPIEFVMSKKNEITIDIAEENIQFPKEGLSFGLEMIGRLNKDGKISKENSYVRPKITSQYIQGFEANTFLHSIFPIETNFYNIDNHNEALSRDFKRHKTSHYSLNIGMTLSGDKY